MILILCGKSCTGKDTVRKELVRYHGFIPMVSATTRPKRDNEEQGVDYIFMSLHEFEENLNKDNFIEVRKFNTLVGGKPDTWFYGTLKLNINEEKDYVTILDPSGARHFIDHYGTRNCCLVCIESDDYYRESRARNRVNFDETEWVRRVQADQNDFNFDRDMKHNICAYVTNNFDIDDCVDKIIYFYNEYKKEMCK